MGVGRAGLHGPSLREIRSGDRKHASIGDHRRADGHDDRGAELQGRSTSKHTEQYDDLSKFHVVPPRRRSPAHACGAAGVTLAGALGDTYQCTASRQVVVRFHACFGRPRRLQQDGDNSSRRTFPVLEASWRCQQRRQAAPRTPRSARPGRRTYSQDEVQARLMSTRPIIDLASAAFPRRQLQRHRDQPDGEERIIATIASSAPARLLASNRPAQEDRMREANETVELGPARRNSAARQNTRQ